MLVNIKYISKGSGIHEFNTTVKPKNWVSEENLNVWACRDEIPKIDYW